MPMNLRFLLLPFAIVYAGVARVRNIFFNSGIFKQRSFDFPVILVGNLSVGGTGKTPHVEYIVRELQKYYRIATLSRGYGRKSSGFVLAGKGVTAYEIGDEPMQYFSKFDDITVAVCENRVEGIEKLMALDKKLQVIVMDDGYQHRNVNPGFKILLSSRDKLFTRDYVLPAGDLREPRSAYKRANCIIITRSNENISQEEKDQISNEIGLKDGQHIFFSSLVYDDPIHFFSYQKITKQELKTKQVLLFTGIANSSHLVQYLKDTTAAMQSIKFSDHHEYTAKDILVIREKFDKFEGNNKIIITTEKDYQRLRNTVFIKELDSLPFYFIPIKISIDKEETFNHLIINYVKENTGNS